MAYSDEVVAAFALAHELHGNQVRKGCPAPYLTHLMAVAATVGEYGGTEQQVIVALLHDAVEDQGGQATLERIRERFGAEVADYVMTCSDTDRTPKPPWRERKEAYIAKLAGASGEVKLIVAADKLHNLRGLATLLREEGPAMWGRFRGGRDGLRWYYAEVLRALASGWQHAILPDLADALDRLERLDAASQ